MAKWKLISWNVNGVRAMAKKGFAEWVAEEKPDVLCIQETKAQEEQLGTDITELEGYQSTWVSAEKKGYSGVGLYTRHEPARITDTFADGRFVSEGRTMIVEYPEFTLFNVYFPNGKKNKERLDYKMDFYEAILEEWESLRKSGKRIIICGDVNTAHKEIDLARPTENSKISGFLPEERAWIDKIIEKGYVDVLRQHTQEPDIYTYWDMKTRARDRNVGWRIDYFYVTDDLAPNVSKAWVNSDVLGSDHCPISIEIETA